MPVEHVETVDAECNTDFKDSEKRNANIESR